MLVTFLERAALSRSGPMFMVGEHADLPEDTAQEFIALGVVEAVDPPPPAPPAPPAPAPAAPPTVDKPERDRMIKKGEVVRK